jgi:hypothetical protein
MDEETLLRLFVRDDVLTPKNQARIHEARGGFFDSSHHPASTMVGISALVAEDALLKLEAEIPDDEWSAGGRPDKTSD